MFVCTGVVFTAAMIAGVAAWAAANAWLTNRREARAAQEKREEARNRFERRTWVELCDMRAEKIRDLEGQLDRMETLYGIARKLLDESEQRRLQKLETAGFAGDEDHAVKEEARA